MTNPNDGKALTPKEAVEKVGSIINDQVHAMRSHASVYCSDRESGQMRSEAEFLAEALAVLEALAEENAKLKTALKELAENIHPEAAYISRVEEYTKLECQFYALQDENASLKADLARYRRFDPLIEAAESDGEFSVVGETSLVADKVIRAVVNLRAALKCLEKAIQKGK